MIKYLLLLPLLFSCGGRQKLSGPEEEAFIEKHHCREATARVNEFKTWKVESSETFMFHEEVITWKFVSNPRKPEEKVLMDYSDGILLEVEYAKDKAYIEYNFWKLVLERQEKGLGWQHKDYKDIITGQYFCEMSSSDE